MRLAVDGGGYASATGAFENANQLAALHHDALTHILGRYAAMAGDDASAGDFAAAYDDAAREGVGSLGDLVDAFASAGRLTTACLSRHRDAEHASVLGGALVYDGDLPTRGYVTVRPASVPSSLGGDPSSLPAELNWIVDQVEGFVWPDADLDRLRAAAGTWRAAARHVGGLTDYTDGALRGFAHEVSPEVAQAESATGELAACVGELSGQYGDLATACDTYADHVEQQRREILDLVWSLLRDAVIVQGVGIVLGTVTAGLTAAGAAAINAAKIAAAAPRFARIVATLRTLVRAAADAVRLTVAAVGRVRARLRKFLGVRLAVRDERGAINVGALTSGWLRRHEVRGSHTVARHVGKSDAWLQRRMLHDSRLARSSSFTDKATAERALRDLFATKKGSIDAWLAADSRSLSLEGAADTVIGRTATPNGGVMDVRGYRVILVRDAQMPDGYRVLTAFPQP